MKKIKDIMSHTVDVIHPNANLLQAANKMKKHNVGVLPVCDGERLKGMLTDRDIVVRGLADRRDLETMRVAEIMSGGVYYCYEDEDITDASEIMQERKVRRLVVLNRSKRLVGLLSLEDLALESRSGDIIKKTLQKNKVKKGFKEKNGTLGMSSTLVGSFVGTFVLGLGYFFINQNKEVKDKLRQVIPLNRGITKVA